MSGEKALMSSVCPDKNKGISNVFAGKSTQILLLILAVALALRLWGIWFGLPYLYGVDEGHEVFRALRLGMGSFDFSRVGKGGYFYVLFVEYGIYFIILKLTGIVASAKDFAYRFIQDPWSFYLIGRVTTAFVGTFTVFITYIIGKKVYSQRCAVFAALFLAFNYSHAVNSHYIQVDVPMACLSTIALMYALRIATSGKFKDYIWGAFFTGLAIITKLPAVMLLVPVIVAHFFSSRRDPNVIGQFLFGKRIIVGSILCFIVITLGEPGLVLNFKDILIHNLRDLSGTKVSLPQGVVDRPNLFLFYLKVLKTSMGVPLFVISMLGIGYGVYRRKEQDVILIAFVLCYYFVLSMSGRAYLYYPRYMMPILPPLILLASTLLDKISLKIRPNSAMALSSLLACLLIMGPGYRIARHNYLISHKDTRTFAKEWIEENIPEGSKILIEGSRTKVIRGTAPLQNHRENILKSIAKYRDMEPGKAKYFELELDALSGITYDLVMIGPPLGASGVQLKSLRYYKEIGVKYLVLRPDMYVRHRKLKKFPYFVQNVREDPEVVLLKRFEPDSLNRPGPAIEIFQVKRPSTSNEMAACDKLWMNL